MKKKYGQNFLTNQSIVKEIIQAAEIKNSAKVCLGKHQRTVVP